MKTSKNIPSLLASAVLVILTVIGTFVMLTSKPEGLLVAYGFRNLKFFTVDSNLFLGIVYLADLILAHVRPSEKTERIGNGIERLIYIATVAVSLTFCVVVLFFGPTVGYRYLFHGSNLYFHLILPVLAIIFFCIFHRGRSIPMRDTALALIPTLLYAAYYIALILIFGVHFPETDWYAFTNGGLAGSVIMASSIILATWILALLLRLAAGVKKRGNIQPPQ